MSDHTRSGIGTFLCASSRLGLSILAQDGRTPLATADISAYKERLALNDPFREPVLRLGRAGVFQGEDLLPNEGLLRTGLYRDLAAPLGYRYVTAIVLTVSVRRLEVISVWRRIDQGPMGEDGNRLLNLLVPHIQKALEIRQVLGVTQQRLAGGEAMADASSTATFLLNRQGCLIHSSAAADSLVSDKTAVALQNGVLVAADVQSRDSLRALVMRAASHAYAPPAPAPTHAQSLPRTGSRQPLQLIATPLPHTHRDRSGADLLLLVTGPESSFCYPDTVLRALYGLTPAETEIANGLLTGYSLQEIASLRRVSIGSKRNQLKSKLSKTSTARQSDLMRLLMALPHPSPCSPNS